jgi:hypothetical protein
MKKQFLLLCAVGAILLPAPPSFAASPFGTPAPAPAAINIYDWYNLGEYVSASNQWDFNASVYDQMDDTYKQFYDVMGKAHCSDGTINAFKQWYTVVKALPWDKDWQTWTKEQQNAWKSAPARDAWQKGVYQDANKEVESVFFYTLGWDILSLAWTVSDYQNQGYDKGVKDLIANSAGDFTAFSTDAKYSGIFSALTPDVQTAMTFIAAAKKKVSGAPNPFAKSGDQAGLTADDISKIVEAAKVIRAAAQANQLTK